MSPGSSVAPGSSITVASAGAVTLTADPTATMCSPSVSTTQPGCGGSPAVHTCAGRSSVAGEAARAPAPAPVESDAGALAPAAAIPGADAQMTAALSRAHARTSFIVVSPDLNDSSPRMKSSAARPGRLSQATSVHGARETAPRSGSHQYRRIVAFESLDGARICVEYQTLRELVDAWRQQHAQHDVIGRSGRLFCEQLLDDARQPMIELVHEAQVRAVVNLIGGTVSPAGLLGKLMQEQIQEPRFVDQPQLRVEVDFGVKVHDVTVPGSLPTRPGRSRWVWWS